MRRRCNRRRRYNKNACLNANFLCERAAFSARFSDDFYGIFRQKQTVFCNFSHSYTRCRAYIDLYAILRHGRHQTKSGLSARQANSLPLGKVLSQTGAKVIVARDVRTHSKEIEKQLCKGLLEGSAQIWLAGVLPTPALAYTAQTQKADYAVMITASHNAPEFNGLKVFGKHGKKLSKEEEIALDDKLVELKTIPHRPYLWWTCARTHSPRMKN